MILIEEIVLNYLKQIDDLKVNVYMEEPLEKEDSFLLVQKVGNRGDDFLKTSSVAVQSFAKSKYEAASLDLEVQKMMLKIISVPVITKIVLSTGYDFTDTSKKRYRYQSVFDITHY